MTLASQTQAAQGQSLVPFVFWNPVVSGSAGAPLACPQCTSPNMHLAAVSFAVPAGPDHYTPTIGLDIDTVTGDLHTSGEANKLHAAQNRGAMIAIRYWCEQGCEGRIELREHKGYLYSSLHNETQ